MVKKCKQCHNLFTVGLNGIADGRCDKCAGVQRDREGYAWFAWETEHTYQDVETERIYTVTRAEAFGG